ncbi:MAG: alpha/beta hydrolase [Spirochaetales bacterium]|nr:alpha/beta hydrolase [Spirochaetales bacterium]
MKPRNARTLCLIATLTLAVPQAFAQSQWLGRWEGAMTLTEGALPFGLTVGQNGALLDLPTENLFGYPSATITFAGADLEVYWRFGGGVFSMSLKPDGSAIKGSFRQGDAGGTLMMIRSSFQADPASVLDMRARDGRVLPGTLTLPENTGGPVPLVILHAGLGVADRNGNNYNLAGRHDALAQLAAKLAAEGVASYRYDKRGSGLATWQVSTESELSFDAWVSDLVDVTATMAADRRFSSVWLFGLNDGALVAAAAAGKTTAAGLLVACASADSPLDAIQDAVAQAPEEQRAEGQAIVAELLAGRTVRDVAPFYASALRPSLQPYLIEAFRYDLEALLPAYTGRLVIIQGDMDLQATVADFSALTEAAPRAETVLVPGMNHVLKEVSADVAVNNAAFSDPSYNVSGALVMAVADFIAGL